MGNSYVFIALGVSQSEIKDKMKVGVVCDGGITYIERAFVHIFFLHFSDVLLKTTEHHFQFSTELELRNFELENGIDVCVTSMPSPFLSWGVAHKAQSPQQRDPKFGL